MNILVILLMRVSKCASCYRRKGDADADVRTKYAIHVLLQDSVCWIRYAFSMVHLHNRKVHAVTSLHLRRVSQIVSNKMFKEKH